MIGVSMSANVCVCVSESPLEILLAEAKGPGIQRFARLLKRAGERGHDLGRMAFCICASESSPEAKVPGKGPRVS